jgi:hypothetical protein
MKIGDYLVAKIAYTKNITCGDGIVGKFTINKGDKFKITDIINDQIEIDYNNSSLWFSKTEEPQYFIEYYKLYFYDYNKMNRKLKIKKLNNVKDFHNK